MDTKVSNFKSIRLKLASPEEILSWSRGEVTKPETINYRTQRAEKDGLFCEKIFGPEKDWECYCGKYRRIRYKGIVCDKCGVEVTRSSVRRERMGHIVLAVPVSHIWFLKGLPSKMGLILDRSAQSLEKVIYFAGYIITKISEEERKQVINDIKKEYKAKFKDIVDKTTRRRAHATADERKQKLKGQRDAAIREIRGLYNHQILTEIEYRNLSLKYGQVFEAGTGSETLRTIFEKINLEALARRLQDQKKNANTAAEVKILKRLRLVKGMIRAKIKSEWMFPTILPVLPPDLRPIVQLDGSRYATSDVNDLYRRVINRNNRLKRLLDLKAPEVICRNEKRMLQEAVDALIDNTSRRGQVTVAASTGQKRVLKSLADMLKGKQGRFRQNLLGKRVDYSGRSVIVVGPNLKLHQCGLPKYMALELFKPFVINRLVERELAHNVRGAGRLIEEEIDEVWDILEEVTKNRYVLLNRAPTLHRLGIQAFQPVLIEGKAIQLHPLTCGAFNADFDGDQMAVHLPLSEKAQKEAKEIMLSSKNILKPSTGEPVAVPSLDMVLGCYWMTKIKEGLQGEGKIFANIGEAILAKHFGAVHLQSKIKVRLKEGELTETSVGRIIFNEPLPKEIEFVNKQINKKELRNLIAELVNKLGIEKTALILDKIKRMGFKYASTSGITWSMGDLRVPKGKKKELEKAEHELKTVQSQYNTGLLTDDERKARVIEIWMGVSDRISKKIMETLDPNGSIFDIFDSGARGSLVSLSQMMGMKGLVVNPSNEIIELPIRNSYKEGLSVLEYFISTHGGRKGLADTALKTAQAGYLTRRLVDVCQDVVIREKDCRDKKGINIYRKDEEDLDCVFARRVVGRVILDDVYSDKSAKKKLLAKAGELIDKETALEIDKAGIDKIRARSVITCQSLSGVCQKCYGYDLGRNELIKLGEAIGIVTAQAIGEPATQLTLRTFHTGGVAGEQDITQGLPRVEEIFEARVPKGKAIISEVDGKVKNIIKQGNQKIVQIEPLEEVMPPAKKKTSKGEKKNKKADNKRKILEYTIPEQITLMVEKGELISKGQQLSEGHINLQDLYKVAGKEAVQRYILKEIQRIYTFAGENISDKHIEMIIRQMFSRYSVKNPGSTNLLAGEIVEQNRFLMENREAKKKGKQLASGQPILLGITKTSLTTESFLSAASFIQTTQVLINASIQGKEDKLKGLKENVIIGKLIPAGTGYQE